MVQRISLAFLAFTVAMLGGGCAHRGPTATLEAEAEGPYRIGREDVLDISVWRDADLSRTVPVRPDGYISLPLIGELAADGKTPPELAAAIKEKLRPYVQEPKVAVIVREINASKVFVTGQVTKPGSYPLRGRMTVLQAIALAGGFTDFASENSIMVIRQGERPAQIPVRYSDLISPSPEEGSKDLLLRPGDTVVVP
jgi:polysaccharide export outer membrane protein